MVNGRLTQQSVNTRLQIEGEQFARGFGPIGGHRLIS
jgi:hypothetical protein